MEWPFGDLPHDDGDCSGFGLEAPARELERAFASSSSSGAASPGSIGSIPESCPAAARRSAGDLPRTRSPWTSTQRSLQPGLGICKPHGRHSITASAIISTRADLRSSQRYAHQDRFTWRWPSSVPAKFARGERGFASGATPFGRTFDPGDLLGPSSTSAAAFGDSPWDGHSKSRWDPFDALGELRSLTDLWRSKRSVLHGGTTICYHGNGGVPGQEESDQGCSSMPQTSPP